MSDKSKTGRLPHARRGGPSARDRRAPARGLANFGPVKIQPVPRVIDNFPDLIPATEREIEVIETYLGALLDEVFENELEMENDRQVQGEKP